MDNTYIKLFRNLLNWEWYKDANTMRVFLHILLNANYKPRRYKGYEIPAGACVFGRKSCAAALGLTEQQVRTAINHLKSTNEITTKTTNRFTIVFVEKWDLWQMSDGQATNKTTNKRTNKQPTTNQQLTTPKESKKVRIKENYYLSKKEQEAKALDDVVTDFWAKRGVNIDTDN